MRRIAVIGTTGSGKTTLAREIAARTRLPHIELDALHWGPNWTEAPRETFRDRVTAALQSNAWVVDGNYSKVRDLVWARADTIVWLDYPLWLILWRLIGRTSRRVIAREELWSGNRETLRGAFFSKNSLFMWALQTYQRRRRDYPLLLGQPAYAHLRTVWLRSSRETQQWLSTLGAGRVCEEADQRGSS